MAGECSGSARLASIQCLAVTLIPDELRVAAARCPERIAVEVVDEDAMTFGEWEVRSNTLAGMLVDLGVQPDDRVMLLLPPSMATRFAVAYIAAHRAGAIVVPVNSRYAARELEHVARNCEPAMIVTGGDQEPRARALGVTAVVGDDEWAAAIDGDRSPLQVSRSPSDLAEILYTSGTTGLPKGVTSTTRACSPTRRLRSTARSRCCTLRPCRRRSGVSGR
jgi:acyl-CoA synthetase (AMP-forming)/AMP-acid ligase II